MHELARWIISIVGRRLRSRAVVELENLALRHQLHVLRRQRPGRPLSLPKIQSGAQFEQERAFLPDPQVAPSPVAPDRPILDTGIALSFIAANTAKIRLGTGIIILPQRNPVVLAKELASLDVLSNGRLIFGIGIGSSSRSSTRSARHSTIKDRARKSISKR